MAKELVTSAAANKMIRQLQDEKEYLLQMENSTSTYVEVAGYETEMPEYCYRDLQTKISMLDHKIRSIKHAINVFNCTTVLPKCTLTVDEALVKMAQLNRQKERLDVMRKRTPKSRKQDRFGDSSKLVEYICTNYDIEEVKKDYDRLVDQINQLQMGIDYVNQTEKFEIEYMLD